MLKPKQIIEPLPDISKETNYPHRGTASGQDLIANESREILIRELFALMKQ